MPAQTDHAAMAALSICEARLRAMNERELLPKHEIVVVLRDAAAAPDTHLVWTPAGKRTVRSPL